MKLCLFCKHCDFDIGGAGYETEVGCNLNLQITPYINTDRGKEEFVKWNKVAENCNSYTPE